MQTPWDGDGALVRVRSDDLLVSEYRVGCRSVSGVHTHSGRLRSVGGRIGGPENFSRPD